MRLSIGSTDWCAFRALAVVRTSFSADGVITIFTGVVRPVRFITHIKQTVCIVSITTNINRPRVTLVCPNVADLITSTVHVFTAATQVRSPTMSTHRIVGGTEAVVWTAWDTAIGDTITIFTGSVRIGRCVTFVVLALIVGGAFEAFTPLAVTT